MQTHDKIVQEVPAYVAEAPPGYFAGCQREGCGAPATHTIVLHFWPVDTHRLFRHARNSVKMFPGVVACDAHKFSLSEIGLHVLATAHGHVRLLFEKLSKAGPDLADPLIDLKTIDEAMKLWREPSPLN
jgi:hypothetical protein